MVIKPSAKVIHVLPEANKDFINYINQSVMTNGELFDHCQSNLIKPHPHSPEEAN